MSAAAFALRPAAPGDPGSAAFRHALRADPEGAYVAVDGVGAPVGRAAGSVREDTLRLATLEVEEAARGRGVGSALFDAVRAYGGARGASALETECPLEPASLAFAAKKRLPVRTLVLALELSKAPEDAGRPSALEVEPFVPGAGLSGWVAALERETRGYALTPDWPLWLRGGGRAFALRRGGRPEGIAAIFAEEEHQNVVHIGPLSAKTPTSASAALAPLSVLARASGARRVTVSVSADARLLLDVALGLGFRVTGARALLSTRPRGDLRRTIGGPAFF